MALQAMWVPGYVAAAENVGGGGSGDGPLENFDGGPLGNVLNHSYQDIVGYRQGFGVRFRGKANQQVWFHFAIPTPVIVGDAGTLVVRAFVLWRTNDNARLLRVDIWDGARTALQRFPVGPTGDGLTGIFDGSPDQPEADPKLVEKANMFTLDTPQHAFYGLGISALIGFDPHSNDSQVIFASAGADFTT